MVKPKDFVSIKKKLQAQLETLKEREEDKLCKEIERHEKEIETILNRFQRLKDKVLIEIEEIEQDELDEPITINNKTFYTQREVDAYKKTDEFKKKECKHKLQCPICRKWFFGYNLAMYRQAPLLKQKQTKFYQHFKINGGTCEKHCKKCGKEFFSYKGKKNHKCKGEVMTWHDKNHSDCSEYETESESNVEYETETETETETESIYNPASLETIKEETKDIEYLVKYIETDEKIKGFKMFKIKENLFYHKLKENIVYDCLSKKIGRVENNILVFN